MNPVAANRFKSDIRVDNSEDLRHRTTRHAERLMQELPMLRLSHRQRITKEACMGTSLGNRILFYLQEAGMTRKELCEKTGITEAALSRYITGQREPRAVTLSSIAKALNVTMDDLLGTSTKDSATLHGAIRLVARNSKQLTPEQRKFLIDSLLNF